MKTNPDITGARVRGKIFLRQYLKKKNRMALVYDCESCDALPYFCYQRSDIEWPWAARLLYPREEQVQFLFNTLVRGIFPRENQVKRHTSDSDSSNNISFFSQQYTGMIFDELRYCCFSSLILNDSKHVKKLFQCSFNINRLSSQ